MARAGQGWCRSRPDGELVGSEVASGNWGAKSGAQGGDGGGEETVAAGEGNGVASRTPPGRRFCNKMHTGSSFGV